MATIKFYDLTADPTKSTRFFSPNTWKTRMALLHKQVKFETVPVTLLDIRGPIAKRSGLPNIQAPAIELPDGTFLYDSFRISEWLETAYPDAPSLFTGDGQSTRQANPAHLTTGKAYARLVDLGLGSSSPEWAVWFELCFPEVCKFHQEGVPGLYEYFISDQRLGPSGREKLFALDRVELIRRAKLTVTPLIQILRERPGEYLQGKFPGQADYVLFGRYAYCRLLNKEIAKEVWDDQAPELASWVQKLSQAFNGHAQKIFDEND
ncbi:hypothetical protein SpCBS45565_g02586 [Spizellomyces sp. 'palustris']|nr:hypothetical protein SpCBS45565_g02586 [Spizellomyces sp. 'palustris']